MKTIILSVALLLVALGSHAQNGSITNIQVSQGTGENERLVSIQFDLSGSDASYNLALEVSFNNGFTFTPINPAHVTGPLNVPPGNGIQLLWDGRISYPQAYSTTARIRITATSVVTGRTFTDIRDGNIYKCVTIGDQVWMAENLRYLPEPEPEKFVPTLSLVGPGTGSQSDPYAYVYGYEGTDVTAAKLTDNYLNYGVLYNWPAATGYAPIKNGFVQGVCPLGWHLPSLAEWSQLNDHIGGELNGGGLLKSTRTAPEDGHPRWDSPNTSASDAYGFSALPGGYRHVGGSFLQRGEYGFWWTTDNDTSIYMDYSSSIVTSNTDAKDYGFSVRCVKDSN